MNESPFAQDYAQSRLSLPYFKAWIVFYLLATFIGMGAGMLIGGIIGIAMTAAGMDQSRLPLAGGVGGFLIALPISFICYRWSIQKFILPSVGVQESEM